MTTTYKVLGQLNPTAGSLQTLYTCGSSGGAVCSTLTACNMGVSTTVRVAVRPAGATIDPKHYRVYEATLNAYDSLLLTTGITLANTDVVSVQAGTANVAFNLDGSEIS